MTSIRSFTALVVFSLLATPVMADGFLNNPAMAGAMGKLVRVGNQRAIQDGDGNVKMVVANKFLVSIEGSADTASKLAYAQAIDLARLSKM
jgi:hypothetical protein